MSKYKICPNCKKRLPSALPFCLDCNTDLSGVEILDDSDLSTEISIKDRETLAALKELYEKGNTDKAIEILKKMYFSFKDEGDQSVIGAYLLSLAARNVSEAKSEADSLGWEFWGTWLIDSMFAFENNNLALATDGIQRHMNDSLPEEAMKLFQAYEVFLYYNDPYEDKGEWLKEILSLPTGQNSFSTLFNTSIKDRICLPIYNNACSLLKNGISNLDTDSVNSAIQFFTQIDTYRDSKKQIEEANTELKSITDKLTHYQDVYSKAKALMLQNDYPAAICEFKKIPEWKDSRTMIEKCQNLQKNLLDAKTEETYRKAISLTDKQFYEEALNLFKTVINWKDSKDKIEYCKQCISKNNDYTKACDLIDKGDYQKARNIFLTLSPWKDSASKAELCLRKQTEIENGKKDHTYLSAKNLMDKGEYEKALNLFSSLQWKDSVVLSLKCRTIINNDSVYSNANNCYKNGQYTAALKLFSSINPWKESQKMIDSCKKIINQQEEEKKKDAMLNNLKMEMAKLQKEKEILDSHTLDSLKKEYEELQEKKRLLDEKKKKRKKILLVIPIICTVAGIAITFIALSR